MSKNGFKAFVYSFSVSVFAIVSANRAFWHTPSSKNEPLIVSNKNIVLFLKNVQPLKHPVKKIALNALPELEPKVVMPDTVPEPEIILASDLEDIDIPLEIEAISQPADTSKELVLADVLYAPDKPIPPQKIEAEPVYQPEKSNDTKLTAPVYQPPLDTRQSVVTASEASAGKPRIEKQENHSSTLANNEPNAPIPLQMRKNHTLPQKVSIGNPNDLNHIALNDSKIPIQSMEKDVADNLSENKSAEKQWKSLNDSPWVVARSSGSKNLMAQKEFADKSNEEISKALNAYEKRDGLQLASETVKNIIIPIPGEIMEKDDLTPKLAYPSTSEDAEKEKIIEAKIKLQDQLSKSTPIKKEKVLSPIEDEISLDKNDTEKNITPIKPVQTAEVKKDTNTSKDKKSGGIIGTLNSIFQKTDKSISEAKEKAIAKAQAKKTFRKRTAKVRPISIMPTEIRLSFQPNRAEISGQTLRWVQAFATKTAETPNMFLEIRIDGTTTTALQQKRLNLLHNILINKGVEYSKINTVFTSREPNSFILRTITNDNSTGENNRKINNKQHSEYIQW